jgi:hypothetical protein
MTDTFKSLGDAAQPLVERHDHRHALLDAKERIQAIETYCRVNKADNLVTNMTVVGLRWLNDILAIINDQPRTVWRPATLDGQEARDELHLKRWNDFNSDRREP